MISKKNIKFFSKYIRDTFEGYFNSELRDLELLFEITVENQDYFQWIPVFEEEKIAVTPPFHLIFKKLECDAYIAADEGNLVFKVYFSYTHHDKERNEYVTNHDKDRDEYEIGIQFNTRTGKISYF